MTPIKTLEALCSFLEHELRGILPDDDKGTERPITVYRFHLPEPSPTQMTQLLQPGDLISPESYESIMPAVVVSPLLFEDKVFEDVSSLLAISIVVGCYSKDVTNQAGPYAVVNILERIRLLLLEKRVLENVCELQEPLVWELYDESHRPLWFGEMTTQWRIAVPQRIDEDDWRGDFLKGRDLIGNQEKR